MTPVLLFDDLLADLGPLSDLRASYEQRSGALTAVERWQLQGRLGGVIAASACAELRAARLAPVGVPVNPRVPDAILVNGRADVTAQQADALERGGSLVAGDGTVLALRLAGGVLDDFVNALKEGAEAGPRQAAAAPNAPSAQTPGQASTAGATAPNPAATWSRPWHLLDPVSLNARMQADFALIMAKWSATDHGSVPSWATIAGRGHAHVHASAQIGAGVVLDTSAGPILLDEGCEVRHGAILVGPVYVGKGSIVAERAHLKARTVLGPQCRAGGEIGSAIFQAFGNKVHDGHLGDALVGEWVNLGAGTVNSNLLNTYGEVAMRLRPGGAMQRTGRQFMGCVIGDHTKVAIGTRIMTGASIGTGTMWAATAPITGAVEPFAWVTDDGRRMYQPEKFVQLARTVMGRRNRQLEPAEERAVRALMAAASQAAPSQAGAVAGKVAAGPVAGKGTA